MDDLRRIRYGSGYLQEDDEVSGRGVRPGEGASVPSGSLGTFLFEANKLKIEEEYMESRLNLLVISNSSLPQ